MSIRGHSDRHQKNLEHQLPSKVLLVCVYDTISFNLNQYIVEETFHQFGKITKILIFQKTNKVTKFFIEFSHLESATLQHLNGSNLINTNYKMNIYFSSLCKVDTKRESLMDNEQTFQDQNQINFINRYDQLTKSSPQEDTEVFNDLIMQSFHAVSPFSRSKTDTAAQLTNYLNKVKKQSPKTIIDSSEIQVSIISNIDSILESHSSSNKEKSIKQGYNPSTPKKQPDVISHLAIKEHLLSKNSVLCFNYVREISVTSVYNLFSNFGNISCITKKKNLFYLKFRSAQFAAISSSYLNNYRLMGNLLSLDSPSSEDEAKPKENQWSECIYFDASFDRFTPQKSISINSPSVTLHVSSLKRDICKENTLRDIFQEYGQVEYVRILKQSSDKNMALIKFYTIDDSFRAIACLHNQNFSGRKIQISFSKSRS